jgi:hypothetical protein
MFRPLIIALLLVSATRTFADDAERMAKAETEGQVVFYTSMGIDTVRPVTLSFEKKYPFIEVEVLRLNSERVFNRVMIEHQTGKLHADVVNMSVMPLLKISECWPHTDRRKPAHSPPSLETLMIPGPGSSEITW